MTNTPDGQRWAARLEIHETDAADEPDMTKWTTQLAFRLSGQYTPLALPCLGPAISAVAVLDYVFEAGAILSVPPANMIA